MSKDVKVPISPVLNKKAWDKAIRGLEGDAVGMDLEFTRQSLSAFRKNLESATVAGTKNGFDKASTSFRSSIRKASEGFTATQNEINALVEKMASGAEEVSKDQLAAALNRHKVEMKTAEDLLKANLRAMKPFEEAEGHGKKWSEMVGQGSSHAVAEVSEGLEKAAEDFISKLRSGDIPGLMQSLAGGARQASGMATAGGNAKLGAQLAKAASGIAAAAAAVGAIAVVVKLLIDAQSQAAEMNKNLVSAAGASMILGDGTAALRDNLHDIRDATSDFAYSFRTALSASEQQEILSSLMEAGVTLGEITQGAQDGTEQIQRSTTLVATYARLMGMSFTEASTKMAEQADILGTNLEGVAEGFSEINQMAMQSGFGVSRFQSMVLQATSGMALYNVRLEESAALLVQLGKILGQEQGGEFLASISGQMRGESTEDRIRRAYLSEGELRRIMRADVEAQMGSVYDRLGENTRVGFLSTIASVTGGSYENSAAGFSEAMQAMAELDTASLNSLRYALSEIDPAANRTLVGIFDQLNALAGSGPQSLAMGLDSLSTTAALAAQFAQANAILQLGGDPATLAENLSATQEISLAQMMGVDTDKIREIQEAYRSMTEGFNRAVAGGDFAGTFEEYLVNLSDQTESIANVEQDIRLMEEVASNTRTVGQVLEMGVQAVLENIYGLLERWFGWLSRDSVSLSDRRSALEEVGQRESALAEQLIASQNRLAELERTSAISGSTPEIASEMASLRESIAQTSRDIEITRSRRSLIAGATTQQELNTALQGATLGMLSGEMRTRVGRLQATLQDRDLNQMQKNELVENLGFERTFSQTASGGLQTTSYSYMGQEVARSVGSELEILESAINSQTRSLGRNAEDLVSTQADATADAIAEEQRSTARRQLLNLMGPERMMTGDFRMSDDILRLMGEAGITRPVNDFIYRTGNNSITPIDTQDDLVGFRPGGPVDRMGSSLPGVTINIHGGNEERIYSVVSRALRDRGIRPPRMKNG